MASKGSDWIRADHEMIFLTANGWTHTKCSQSGPFHWDDLESAKEDLERNCPFTEKKKNFQTTLLLGMGFLVLVEFVTILYLMS